MQNEIMSAHGVRVLGALAFAEPAGYRPIRLDLYRPAREGPAPLIIFFHGGGWMRGSRHVFVAAFNDWTPSPFERLALAGFAVASVDYRLSAEARFPAQLEDVTASLLWLTAQADEYDLDTDRTVLWGSSAGAHLAALLALEHSTGPMDESRAGARIARICGVIDWFGPADLLSMARRPPGDGTADADAPDSREARLLGAPVQTVPELARAASPRAHVHSAAPPFLIAHGTADRLVPIEQSQDLADALRRANVDVEFRAIENADHMWMGVENPEPIFLAGLDFARTVTSHSEPARRPR